MLKRFLTFIFLAILIFSADAIDTRTEKFFLTNNSEALKDLFTLNIAIMKLKNIGNLQQINPIDSQNVVNGIKILMEKIPAGTLSLNEAKIKAINVLINKLSETDKEAARLLRLKLYYTFENDDKDLLNELFKEFKKLQEFENIRQVWFENINNPFYALNISSPLERIIKTEKSYAAFLR